jgi:hypothetical protein
MRISCMSTSSVRGLLIWGPFHMAPLKGKMFMMYINSLKYVASQILLLSTSHPLHDHHLSHIEHTVKMEYLNHNWRGLYLLRS